MGCELRPIPKRVGFFRKSDEEGTENQFVSTKSEELVS